MKLISSKRTKRRIALMFVFAFMLSNVLSLIGPSAHAASVTPPSTGTCFQHTGTVAAGSLVTVYNIGTIQITAANNELNPGNDASGVAGTTTGVARATSATGTISTDTNIIGNILQIIPPTGTNFVIVPGFQTFGTLGQGGSNLLAAANASITGAQSTESSTGGTADSNLGISVGVVTNGTAGVGRVIIAVAKDADSSGTTAASESFPKSGTGTNNAQITVTGLGLAVPPSGDGSGALSGTLAATVSSTVPSGTGTAGAAAGGNVGSLITNFSSTVNLCTVSSAAGKLVAELDTDSTTDLYDKNAASNNVIALGSIGSNTSVDVFDTTSVASAALLDLEPIIIRGNSSATTGSSASDQVFATGALLGTGSGGPGDIDLAAEAGSGSPGLTLSTAFGNSATTPIQITITDDNSTAVSTLSAVDILLFDTGAGSPTTVSGAATTQTSRHGFLGALRAATNQGGAVITTGNGTTWGVASVGSGPGTEIIQETWLASAGTGSVGGLTASLTSNATEPNHPLTDLRLQCQSSSNPVVGWFALLSSSSATFGTTSAGALQLVRQSQAGGKIAVGGSPQDSVTNFFTQALTSITGSNPSPVWTGTADAATYTGQTDSGTPNNAILYAQCQGNTVTLIPIQNGFDGFRDILAVTPRVTLSNVSNTLATDVNLQAQVSGNNLSGTTVLTLATLLGVPSSGTGSSFAAAVGAGLTEGGQLTVTCSSGGTSVVTPSQVVSGSIDTAAGSACTSGAIAGAPTFFTGGTLSTVPAGGTTVVKGSPTVQGQPRAVVVKELTESGFANLCNQVGGSTQGTVFEVRLPTGCDVVDDNDDSTTASVSGAGGGNDVARLTGLATGGVGITFASTAALGEVVTTANSLIPASGTDPAKIRFKLTTAPATGTDAATKDAVAVILDAQDLFCPTTVMGDLIASVVAQNKITGATLTQALGTANIGTTGTALSFGFADDVAMSTKGEVSTNTMIGATPRLVGGAAGVSNPFKITELDNLGIPIGGMASGRNVDPENNQLISSLTRGQIWVIPAAGSAFGTAPATADVSFSDTSLVLDGAPTVVTSSTIDANAPIGSLIIGVKKNIAAGAADPGASATTLTIRNLQLTAAASGTGDLVASVEFFSQDGGVIINTPGIAAGNNASTPTLFTPYVQAGTKAAAQLEVAGVQLGTGNQSLSQLTARATTLGTPQLNPFAKALASQMNADTSKITASASALSSSGSPATDNVVTVTGTAGAVDSGAQVVISTGATTTYDSVTVTASDDGSFTGKARGDCASPATSVSVSIAQQVSGTKSTSVTKTATCGGGPASGQTADQVVTEIAGADGKATVDEVLSYVSGKGGLSAVIIAGGAILQGVINAAKSALGIS